MEFELGSAVQLAREEVHHRGTPRKDEQGSKGRLTDLLTG
jgi:hypothetical protein